MRPKEIDENKYSFFKELSLDGYLLTFGNNTGTGQSMEVAACSAGLRKGEIMNDYYIKKWIESREMTRLLCWLLKWTVIISILILAARGAMADEMDTLIDALVKVESGGNAVAVGDNEKAVGILQIWPVMVKDVNRIIGREKYTLKDRLNPACSREMCRIYLNHYCKGKSFEYMARCWNSGPTGWKKQATLKYWAKVKKEIEK